jgi:hypothetical protein
LRGQAVVARRKLVELQATMGRLIPQIRHWLRTGFVASGKILNLHMPQVYSSVRGKVGKPVEFGQAWGTTRLGGGFVLATRSGSKTELTDTSYAVRAVEDLKGLFGKAPRGYAYDRGGYSAENVNRLRNLGVRDTGLAPRGRAPWAVAGKVKGRLVRERDGRGHDRHPQVPEVRLQPPRGTLNRDDGRMRPTCRARLESHQAGSGCCSEAGDCAGAMRAVVALRARLASERRPPGWRRHGIAHQRDRAPEFPDKL